MSATPTSERGRRVLVAGGGVAGLETLLALHALAGRRVAVSLLTPEEEFVYRPLSVAEPFNLGEVRRYSLPALVGEVDAELVRGQLRAVDADRRLALLSDGSELSYDDLVVALGVQRRSVFPEALTFVDQSSVQGYRDLLAAIERGDVRRIAFVVPPGPVWPFPLYELALQTGTFAAEHGRELELSLATPASAPLALFGERAERAMSEMLEERGIVVHAGYDPEVRERTRVLLHPNGPALDVDRVVALPRLVGPAITGLPHDHEGFLPVDDFGRVEGAQGVWAAGDCTTFPVKQGGLAAQLADVVATTIAAQAGAPVEPLPFRPVLRGVLLTGREPNWLRAEMESGRIGESALSHTALWWPPSKIAGRYLAPRLGVLDDAAAVADPEHGVPIEVSLEAAPESHSGVHRRALIARARDSDEPQIIEFERGGVGL